MREGSDAPEEMTENMMRAVNEGGEGGRARWSRGAQDAQTHTAKWPVDAKRGSTKAADRSLRR